MASRVIYGNWQQELNAGGQGINVFADGTGALAPQKSPGLVRVSPVSILPGLLEHWKIIGWTIRLALVVDATNRAFGTFGKLWGGLAVNSQQSNQGGLSGGGSGVFPGRAQFPPDISTFDVLWDQGDDIALGSFDASQPLPSTVIPALVAKSFPLPVPVAIDPGAQLQMQLVLTPGVYSAQTAIICTSGSWSLIYDDGSAQ